MAFSAILRRSAAVAAPLAARMFAGQRLRHAVAAAASSLVRHGGYSRQPNAFPAPATGFPGRRCYAASSEKDLLRAIRQEILCAEDANDENEADEAPGGFPFKIEDQPGTNSIVLEREYNGETVMVEVDMPDLVNCVFPWNTKHPYFARVVMCCPFHQTHTNGTSMINLSYWDLDENLQEAFHKYLEMRGIKPSTTNFLHEYVINKDNREHLKWLNELKQFVES